MHFTTSSIASCTLKIDGSNTEDVYAVFNVAGNKFDSCDPAKLPGNSAAPISSGLASPVDILAPVLNMPIGCRLLENLSSGEKFSVVPVCSELKSTADESNNAGPEPLVPVPLVPICSELGVTAGEPNNAGPVPLLFGPNKLVLLRSDVLD